MSEPQVAVSGETFDESQRPIVNLIHELARSWNHGEPDAFAAQFGEEADFIHMLGGHIVGRAAIEQAHQALFAGVYAKSHVEYRLEKVKPLGANFAVVFLHQKLIWQDAGVSHELFARPTLVLRGSANGLKIAVFQNTRIADFAPAAAEPEAAAEA